MITVTGSWLLGSSFKCKVMNMSEKYLLTIDEAAEYFNIGKNKLREMIKEPCCNFVLFNGKKALIKKNRLESFLDGTVYL